LDHSGFGGVVVGVVWVTHDAVGGSSLQNYSPMVLHHVARSGLRHVENTSEVDGNYFVPLFGRDIEKIMANADTGVIDQDIDAAHDSYSIVECPLYFFEVRNVCVEGSGQIW